MAINTVVMSATSYTTRWDSPCTTTKRVKGRVVEINADEDILATARAARSTPQFRDRYREQARAERKVAQMKARQSKIPRRGLVNAVHWAELRARALNLDRIGRLDLIT
jgi:hypothetical protein